MTRSILSTKRKNQLKALFIISSIAIITILSGCASIISGGTQMVQISSSNGKPLKATVSNDVIRKEIQLPVLLALDRGEGTLKIEIVDNCYKGTFLDENKINNVAILNFFLIWYTPLAITTDYATGSLWRYDSNIVVPTYYKENNKECK